jgi:hypothetical protein
MKADDRRLERLEHIRPVVAEWRAARARLNRDRIDTQFTIVRQQQVAPSRVAPVVRWRRRVAEEVDVVWFRGLPRDRREFVSQAIRRQHRGRKRTQSAGLRHRDRQLAALDAGHGRLNDWMGDSEGGEK